MASATQSSRRTSPTALRPLSVTLGTLARSDASASFGFGPLEVIAALNGPTEVRIRDELTDRATLDVVFQPQHGVAGIPSKSVSESLSTAFASVLLLHHYPRSLLQLVLQTLSSPPPPQPSVRSADQAPTWRRYQSLLLGPDTPPSVTEKAALINAASLALLDGGIAARGSVAACSCAVLPATPGAVLRKHSHLVDISDSQLQDLIRQESDDARTDGAPTGGRYTGDTIVLLDPTPTEASYALSTHVFAFSFSGESDSDQVFAESLGAVDLEDHQRARALCLEASRSILATMRAAIEKRVLAQVGN